MYPVTASTPTQCSPSSGSTRRKREDARSPRRRRGGVHHARRSRPTTPDQLGGRGRLLPARRLGRSRGRAAAAMSWAAHDLEPYAIQRHLGGKVAIVPLLIGSYSPDAATKWFVYGISAFGVDVGADDPAEFHRGWPGVGFMHSLPFGVVVALLILFVFKSRIWALSFLIGQWAHSF